MDCQETSRTKSKNNLGEARGFAIFLALSFSILSLVSVFAGGTPTTQLRYPFGSASPLGNGDFISASSAPGLDTYYSYFIEVPSGTQNLTVDIFDADIGWRTSAGNNDFNLSGFNTSVTYSLIDPSGATVVTLTCNQACPGFPTPNNSWITLYTTANPANGHWEFRVDMSSAVTAGSDLNGYGFRARDTTGNRELNVYAQSFDELGLIGVPPATSTFTLYPYITAGCNLYSNDFDFDKAGSIQITSWTTNFSRSWNTSSLSANQVWSSINVTGWSTDTRAAEYGLWTNNVTINAYAGGSGNLITYYVRNQWSSNPPPTAQPQANTFRMYLPTYNNGGTPGRPVKPTMSQTLSFISGANPPQWTTPARTNSRVQVNVNVFNWTSFALTFSNSNLVTANVPGGQVLYSGVAGVSQGTITSQPAAGGSGAITWNPGTVNPLVTATMGYQVDVKPTANARVPVTGGTTAVFVDETGNTTQALATYTFGPLCDLAVTPGTGLPTFAGIALFDAYEENGQVVVQWETSYERDTAGFFLYRWNEVAGQYERLGRGLLPGLITAPQGGIYRLIDMGAKPGTSYTYLLEEIEGKGKKRLYGPYEVITGSGQAAPASAREEGQISGYTRVPHPVKVRGGLKLNKVSDIVNTQKSGNQIKITLSADGIYNLDAGTISNLLGISLQDTSNLLKERMLNLSTGGQTVAYTVSKGNSGMQFFGKKVENNYTDKAIYWLRPLLGQKMETAKVSGSGIVSGGSFSDTKHYDKNVFDYTPGFTDPEADYWFWDYLIAGDAVLGKKTFTLNAPGVSPVGGTAALTVRLQGGTNTDHHAIISLNGAALGEAQWKGTTGNPVTFSFGQSILKDGDNNVTVEGVIDSGVPYSIFYLNNFSLQYQRKHLAENDQLEFRGEQPQVTVSGFSGADIMLYDLSDPLKPRVVSGGTISGSGSNWSLSFVPQSSETPYLAQKGTLTPIAKASVAGTLKTGNNKADYVVITAAELKAEAQRLAAYRQGQGYKTMLVEVEQIMDEFSYGNNNPDALKDFLTYASENWTKAPQYVVLAGSGNYDYKNNMGYGGALVPVLMVGTPDGLYPSDTRYADINEDGVPELYLGRLPGATAAEMKILIDKIIGYESSAGGSWVQRALMVADNGDSAGNFPADRDAVATLLPQGYLIQKVTVGESPINDLRTQLFDGIKNGVGLMNYIGHATVSWLSQEQLMTTADVGTMTNATALPFMAGMTCVIGDYGIPGIESLSETLVLRSGGGAIAVWSPSGMSLNDDAVMLDKELMRRLSNSGAKTVGEIVTRVLEEYAKGFSPRYIIDIYNLLGDPALVLKIADSLPMFKK